MAELAKTLILVGAMLIVIGLVMFGFQKLHFFGKLPGDIMIKRENFTFSFPLATSAIISIPLSLILYLISKFRQ
jgi:hypothetical protein